MARRSVSTIYSKHPRINRDTTQEEMRHRALLVALGLVYYVRLDTSYRKKFVNELDRNNTAKLKFKQAFTEEVCNHL